LSFDRSSGPRFSNSSANSCAADSFSAVQGNCFPAVGAVTRRLLQTASDAGNAQRNIVSMNRFVAVRTPGNDISTAHRTALGCVSTSAVTTCPRRQTAAVV
jgi:hypothetical protein